tara:strand:+ start:75953 stop:80305 length:4353 start_codon:yes stop_codon:yes gene_type:complete
MTGDYIKRQEQQERDNAVDADQSKWIAPFAAGMGAIGLGSFLLKRRLTSGGEFVSNMFNFLGVPKGISLSSDVAANVGKSQTRGSNTGIRSILNSTYDVNRNRMNIGPIDIIDDLRNSVEILGNPNVDGSIARHISSRTTEYTHRELVAGGGSTGYFTKGLQRVTFDQVMKDQTAWSRVLGTDQMSVVQRAMERNLVSGSKAIDKKIFHNPLTNEILDLRLRNLTSKVTEVQTKAGPLFQRTAKFDLFGQGELLASIFGPQSRGIALVGPNKKYAGSRVFIGGNTYGYKLNTATRQYDEILTSQNTSLRRAGSPLEIIAASRQGRLDINPAPRKGPLGWIERNLGVGPAFSSRPSFIERYAINPYKRFRALQTGQGTIFKHPFQKQGGPSNAMEAVMGAEFPEMASMGGNYIPVPGGGISQTMGDISGRTWGVIPNRVGLLWGAVDNHSIVKTRAYHKLASEAQNTLSSGDFVVPLKQGGYSVRGKNIPDRSFANQLTDINSDGLTAAGFPSQSKQYGYYDVDKVMGSGALSSAKDFAAYSLYRINSLASETMFGIGFAPSHKISTNLARLATVPLLYETGRQALLYGDYLTEKVTGISPIKAVGSIYAGARLAQQKLREVTGIQQTSDFLDTYFPGSVNSEGSTIIRSILAPMAVASNLLRRGKFTGAAIGAGATYTAIGGPEPGQTSEDLYREYTGDKKVAIRKGAFWGMGYTPFFGGEVERYGTGWYASLMSDYRNKSIYGSDSEYWSYHANVFGVPFPTPSNLFGLSNLLNPYRMEEINKDDRPYIQTSHPIGNFPIIGPILGATLGELMKPTVFRQPDKLPLLRAGLADAGLTPSTARMMGLSSMEATSHEAESPNTITNLIAKQANIATEPLGVYKFAMEFFGISTKPDMGREYATSSTIGDPGRQLYDSSVAGAFGQTEFIRRFLLGDYSAQYRRAAAINPIRNSMPDWLPGAYSATPRDQSYFLDLTQGDPYSKIKDGESRLPGAGYEAINDLHSGRAGEYSDVDRFLILSDVAPYSSAYAQYARKVEGMGLEGRWATRVEEAIEQRRQTIGVDDRYKRYEEDIIALNMDTLSKSVYAPLRKAYDFLTHDVLAEIPYVGSKFFPFRSPHEQYRKTHVEGSEYASWDRPWEGIVRPMVYDTALEDPVTAAGKGAMLGFLISGPMKWFSPLKGLMGAPGHDFNKGTMLLGAVAGAGLSSARIAAGYDQDMLPAHIEQESEAIGYMDKIAYIKGRMIEEAGGPSQYADRTMVGAKNSINFRSALPRSSDRRYFDYFSSQENEDVRSQIVGGLPSYMQQGLQQTWSQNFNSRGQADTETQAFLANNEIPDSNWQGWDPLVSASATKMKFIQHGVNGISNDIHRFGFFESHEVDLKTRLKEFNGQRMDFVQSPMHASFDSFLMNHSKQIKKSSFKINSFSTPMSSSRRDMTIYTNNDKELLDRIRYR